MHLASCSNMAHSRTFPAVHSGGRHEHGWKRVSHVRSRGGRDRGFGGLSGSRVQKRGGVWAGGHEAQNISVFSTACTQGPHAGERTQLRLASESMANSPGRRASATAEHAEHLFRQCSAAPALTQAKSRRDPTGIHHRDATGAQSCQWPEAILFQSACYCRGRF